MLPLDYFLWYSGWPLAPLKAVGSEVFFTSDLCSKISAKFFRCYFSSIFVEIYCISINFQRFSLIIYYKSSRNIKLSCHVTDWYGKLMIRWISNYRYISNLMHIANYLGQFFSVCSATRKKVHNLPKDRARKIRGVFKNPLSIIYLKFL